MKYLYLLVSALFFMNAGNANAQSFTMQADTVIVPPFSGGASPHNLLTNNTGSVLTIRWYVTACDFPADWLTSSAFGICDDSTCRNNSASINLWNPATSSGNYYQSRYYGNSTHDSVGNLSLALDFSSATSSGTHYVTIHLVDLGTGGYTKDVTFKVTKVPVGVPQLSNPVGSIVLYPNPSVDVLHISHDATVSSIMVCSITGQVSGLYPATGTHTILDLGNIPSGAGFIRLLNAQENVVDTKKFIKQ